MLCHPSFRIYWCPVKFSSHRATELTEFFSCPFSERPQARHFVLRRQRHRGCTWLSTR